MIREIKFRAWDNVKNEMYYVGEETNICFEFNSSGIVATDISESEEEFKTLHHLIYMQYTGLTDRKGAEIYEGDVVKGETDIFDQFTGKVVYAGAGYVVDGIGKYTKIREELLSSYEVIGNMFDGNWEMERTAGSRESSVRAEMWHEFYHKVVSGDFNPDTPPVPTIKPGDKVNYHDFQFPNVRSAVVDHLRVHSFGTYAVLRYDGELYTVPLSNVEVVE